MAEIMNDKLWTKHHDEQLHAWLRLSHLQRLQWLVQAKKFVEQLKEIKIISKEEKLEYT